MKRNLLLLAVIAMFGFSSLAVAQDPGAPDTLFLDVFGNDNELYTPTGPHFVRVTMSIYHDVPSAAQDSLAGTVIPLDYTHSNAAKYCSVSGYWNTLSFAGPPAARSIFRHLSGWDNWMQGAYESYLGEEWDTKILDLDGTTHIWLSLAASGLDDRRMEAQAKALWATMTFKLEDSMVVCMDTGFWPPSSRLQFGAGVAPTYTYMPKIWDDYDGTEEWCFEAFIVPNQLPVVNCPGNQSHSVNGWINLAGAVTATDADGTVDDLAIGFAGTGITSFTLENIAGLGTASVTADIKYYVDDHCEPGGTFTVTATDDQMGVGQCTFDVTLTNDDPVITCPPDADVFSDKLYSAVATATDANGDDVEFTKTAGPAGLDVALDGTIEWTPTCDDTVGNPHTVTVMAEDECGATDECTFYLTVICVTNPVVMIGDCVEDPDVCASPGELVWLPIYIDKSFALPLGGFELHVDFDYTSMTLVNVVEGELIDGTQYGDFEKFTYRLLPCPACGCCKYKILLFGMYDLPDSEMGVPIPAGATGVLAWLGFVVNNDQNLRGFCIPVCWQWTPCDYEAPGGYFDPDCGENTFSDETGNVLFTSFYDCQFDLDCCDDPGTPIESIVLFQHDEPLAKDIDCGLIPNCGGVFVCGGDEVCKRGDINDNDVAYEVADAVLFASYFVNGISVFIHDVDAQVCATDVNADGRALTLADLVYLIRVILQDAVEIPKLAPSSDVVNVVVSNNSITTECASSIGAILFEFDGAVVPTLLTDMEMVAGTNKVLLWSREGNAIEAATEVLSFAGDAELVNVSAVDRDSRELSTTITAKVAPTAFALNPAYPNPFNPFTNLSFTLPEAANYSLNIYNVAGQLVRSYDGMGVAGLNVVSWDAKDNAGVEVASGVYFYKLIAGPHTATHKMVMMK